MYDAIIIGAGHNALVTAAELGRAGWKVAVFEKAEATGGAVKTRELTKPGFRHDIAAMNLSLFAGSAFHQRHAARLAGHGLGFVPAQHCFATAFPDGRWFGVSTDVNLTAARIAGFSRKDADTWRAMLGDFGKDAPHIFSVLGTPMRPTALGRTLWKIWRARGTAFVWQMVRLLLASPRAFLDENFESPEIRTALAAWGMHLDFPPDQSGGALFPYLESMANQAFGMVIGKGGAQCMTDALVAMVKETGGEVHCCQEVQEIFVQGGEAKGIRVANGNAYFARKAVIAGVTPGALVNRLLPDGTHNARFDAGARTFRHAPGTMMIHLAMDDLPDWAAGRELRRFAYVHLAPSMAAMNAAYAEAADGLLPRVPVLVVGQPTALDPSRAPAGKHVLWVQVRMVPGTIRGDAAGEIAGTDWAEVKEVYAERVLDMIEGYAPGLRDRIIGRAVVSPHDLEAENPNLVGGDQISGSHHLAQNFLFRPTPGWSDGSTPIKRLYMVGASTWPGAGTGGGSGWMMARRLT